LPLFALLLKSIPLGYGINIRAIVRWLNVWLPVFLIIPLSSAQIQHLSWINYTTDHGLPHNEVYKVLSDSSGQLWFATSQGICRFNGYEFVSPTDTSEQRGSEVFLPTLDVEDRIWFARLDGSVWRIEKDTVRPWEYNAVTAPFREKFTTLEHLVVDQQGTVWLAMNGLGILTVQACGYHRVISVESGQDALIMAFAGSKLIYTTQVIKKDPEGYPPLYDRIQTAWMFKDNCMYLLPQAPVSHPYHHTERGVWALNDNSLLFCFRGVFYLWRNGKVLWKSNRGIWPHLVKETPDGGVIMASHIGFQPGLFYFRSVAAIECEKELNLLPGSFITDFGIDLEGGWWATSIQGGLWYCKNPGMAVLTEHSGLSSKDVRCLTSDGDTTLFAGLRPKGLISINTISNSITQWQSLPFTSRGIDAIYYDEKRNRLWGANPIHYWENGCWNLATSTVTKAQIKLGLSAKRITPSPQRDVIWASSPQGFIRIDAAGDSLTHCSGLNEQEPYIRTFTVTPDFESKLWITTPKGLKYWNGQDYEDPPFQHPSLRFQPLDLALLPEGGMAVALRSAGILIVDPQGCLTQLTTNEGLSADFINKLYCSTEGVLFACSNVGLNRLTRNCDGSWDITVIDTRDGLPSNHINDVIVLANETWVATDKGLARFRYLPESKTMPAPKLEALLVNNVQVQYQPGLKFNHHKNSLSIRFFALHYRSEGQIQYRYRLRGSKNMEYKYTTTREVNFADLSPGNYSLEVQAQNEAGEWSDFAMWSFSILAAWWQTAWFWLGLVSILCLVLTLWYRNRIAQVKNKAEARNKIKELELAALRAQINPHFIFNCLSSIQSFITSNDTDSAVRYLTRFARLVRLALHGSLDGMHSLQEEIEILENYLTLEQLRFPERFTFIIETDASINPDAIYLPPMLIQPYVENAVLHGMRNKEAGGQINLFFTLENQNLLVTVMDNGTGMDTGTSRMSVGSRKSVGMMLTKRRLDILAGMEDNSAFHYEHIFDTTGRILGTKVILRIPIAA
jgi:ligand-binding sensor domain-containing protein